MSPAAISDHIQSLAAYDTPTIANAMESLRIDERRFTGPQIRPATGVAAPVVGVAVTATMKEQSGGKFAHLEAWLQFLNQIETSPLPVIAVFHDESKQPAASAMIGEGMSRVMRAAGAVGALCDGVIRDISGLREIAWPVWAAGATADRGRIRFQRHQVPRWRSPACSSTPEKLFMRMRMVRSSCRQNRCRISWTPRRRSRRTRPVCSICFQNQAFAYQNCMTSTLDR